MDLPPRIPLYTIAVFKDDPGTVYVLSKLTMEEHRHFRFAHSFSMREVSLLAIFSNVH